MGLAQAQGLEVSASTIHRHSQRAVLVRPSTKRRRPRHRPGLVRELLGHSQIGVTMDIYSHSLPNMQQEAMAEMNRLLMA